jgi:hypothetical protein
MGREIGVLVGYEKKRLIRMEGIRKVEWREGKLAYVSVAKRKNGTLDRMQKIITTRFRARRERKIPFLN